MMLKIAASATPRYLRWLPPSFRPPAFYAVIFHDAAAMLSAVDLRCRRRPSVIRKRADAGLDAAMRSEPERDVTPAVRLRARCQDCPPPIRHTPCAPRRARVAF